MASQKPTIVLVHGAWHVPAHYEPVAKPLREAGYEVIMPKNKSVGKDIESDPGDAMRKDAAAIADILRKLVSSGKDVVLLMHSYGGVCGCEAVGMVFEEPNPVKGPGGIRRLVFLAAHVIEKGLSMEGSGRIIPNIDLKDGMMTHTKPYERYYHDVSREDAEPALALLEPMASSAFQTPTSYAGWKDYGIPCTYIKCAKDIAVPESLCDTYISRMRDAGVEVDAETIDSGHSAHFTDPRLVIDVIEKIAV